MVLVRLIAVTVLMGGVAAAQEPAPAGSPITVTGEKPAPKEKVVCKETTTGTVLRKRICLTEAEWSKAGQNSQQSMRQLRDFQRAVRCSFGAIC